MANHTIIKLRRGTAAEWAASEPQPGGEVLRLGEPGYEKDTGKLKIGDGTTPWNSLGYVAGGSSISEEELQDLIGNDFITGGMGISLDYDDANDSLVVSVDPVFPSLQLTNSALIVLPASLGTPVSFAKIVDGGTTAPEETETDPIDDGLTLARGAVGALYNIETQLEYNNSTHAIDGAEWNNDGWGDLLDLSSRSYTTLRSALNNAIGENIIGAELVMHDTINDKYYKFSFSDWGQNNGGSFAYTRTLVSDPNYFQKSDYGDEVDTFVADDPEGDGIGITRGENQGIYNPYQETDWNENTSPAGTEWNIGGWNDLSDIETRTYGNFYDVLGGGQLGNNVVGSELIMHIISTDIYYAIKFLSWTQGGNGGGFSYVKYAINLSEINEGITFADGTLLKSAAGIGPIKSTASANRRIEEVYGDSTVTVTPIETTNLTTTASRSVSGQNIIWIDSTTTTIDDILNDLPAYNITDSSSIEFSLDNNTWYKWGFGTSASGDEKGYSLLVPVSYNVGDTIYFRYNTGGVPQVWWNKNELPNGSSNFRGAIIDYHGFTGEGTFIGTIHIVDDDGEENITHTEVSSGSTDSENDDLWFVQNEGTISYRRMDGEGKTLKIQWSAKVLYGSETYD